MDSQQVSTTHSPAARRRSDREKRIRKVSNYKHLIYFRGLDYLRHWQVLFDWTDEELQKEIEKAKHENVLRLRQAAACPSRFVYNEPDWTGPRFIIAEKDRLRDLQNQADAYDPLFVKCRVRTRGDLW